MSDEAFADLKRAFENALAYERGNRRDLNVTRILLRRRTQGHRKTIFPDRIEE